MRGPLPDRAAALALRMSLGYQPGAIMRNIVWIGIGDVEIMTTPVTEEMYTGKRRSGSATVPARGMILAKAEAWAVERGWRLPTDAEWLAGWAAAMQHWGLMEWTAVTAERVLRGGSWFKDSSDLPASVRVRNLPAYWYIGIGFRCVRRREVVRGPSIEAARKARAGQIAERTRCAGVATGMKMKIDAPITTAGAARVSLWNTACEQIAAAIDTDYPDAEAICRAVLVERGRA